MRYFSKSTADFSSTGFWQSYISRIREFAIEVEDYDEKGAMLHTIFEKSRLSDTELFALNINIAIQLLSSFDGSVVYPKTETKEEIFDDATDSGKGRLIPSGTYFFKRKKNQIIV